MYIPTDIGSRINRVRRSKGIKQEALAKALHISQPAYCMKELGDIPITEPELETIARTLDVTVEYIMQQTETCINQNVENAGTIHGNNNIHGNIQTFNNNPPGLSAEEREFLTEAMRTMQKLAVLLEKLSK